MMSLAFILFPVSLVLGDLNFLAIGDWGGSSDDKPTTKGQIADASGMGKIGKELNVDFVTLLGDNFYSSGIHGDDTCPRFESSFEKVYVADSLAKIPFYAIAGNHDHGGNVTAQIEYTKDSKRWVYPDSYYQINKTFTDENGADVSMDIFFIDTVIIAGNNDDNTEPDREMFEFNGEQINAQPSGPTDQAAADKQWDWLENGMKSSTADYLWVAGHFPVWSACSHGPTGKLVDRLKPMLEKYKGHYMCGHDHCQGHIDEGTGVQYIMAGAGKECCYDGSNVKKNPKDSIKFWMSGKDGSGYQPMPFKMEAGFASFTVAAKATKVIFYSHNGTVLYTVPDILPRKL